MKMRKRQVGILAFCLGILLLSGFPMGLLYRQSKIYEAEKSCLVAELQREDRESARKVLNYLIYQEKYFDKTEPGAADEKTEKFLIEALEQNAYEEQDWYGVERDRRDGVLWKCFFWTLLFFILIIWFFWRYRWGLEKENERLCRLLERGIPVLQQGIEEESLEGLIQYETEWKEFTEHQRVGRIQRAGEMFLKILQLQYRYSEREQERKQQMQNFVENVAHQWKTPLARMTLSLDLMTGENWQEKREDCLREIGGLQPLIERLLNVARMKSGKVVFQLKPLELKMLLMDAGRKVREWQKIQWKWYSEKEEYMIYGDEVWLKQAFFNLYENAGKQKMEVPEISTEIEQEDSGIRIKIRDKGQGIDEKKMKNLFHRFYTGEQEAAGSTGIGLHLAYEIIGRHHGKIDVYNGEKGAVFEVFLPQFALKGKL